MPRYSEEIKQHARELYAQGLSQSEISRRLGVLRHTVGYWVNPAIVERNRRWAKKNTESKRKSKRRWYSQNQERAREDRRQRYQENPERERENSRRWREENRERSRNNARRWAEENPERHRENYKRWTQENPEKVRERNAFRRAAKRQATPPWLTKEQRNQMTALHTEARRLEKVTGVQHHVDHIIPLHAKLNSSGEQIACGLHVPWNLRVMPGPENCAKHCKLPSPEEWTAI